MSMPAFVACQRVMAIVDCFQPRSGSVDARNPCAIAVSFPVGGLGHPRTIADSAIRMFDDAGFSVVSNDSDDRDARFVLADMAA